MANKDSVAKTGNSQALQDSAAFFERVAMSGPGLNVIVSGKDSRILFANSLFEEHTGYTKAALTGMCFTDFLVPYQRDRFLHQLCGVAEGNTEPGSFVIYHLKNSTGALPSFYLYVARVNELNDNGEDVCHLLLLPDRSKWGVPFTSFETKELFLEHFDTESFGTFEWIMDVDKVFWSVGIYRIYEVDPAIQEIDFHFARNFIHPKDKARVRQASTYAMDTGGVLDLEFRIVTALNNVKLVHTIARIVKDNNGQAMKFAGSIRDVTRQREIESDLKNKVEELHRSNRELEEFAYAASHDMQEPLRKITTFSDRLLEKYKDVLVGDGEMYLSRMVASAENMRMLINGLLEFSRISNAAEPFEQVDLNNIIKQVTTELELKIEETATVITSMLLPVIEAEASQMKQLFVNLISNAIKFHKHGVVPVINIDTHEVTDEELQHYNLPQKKQYHKITISDNGIGVEQEYVDRIFQVFQRLHGKSEYPGSGIGLAICKKILEYHKGIIYADNIEGSGARFSIIIPGQQ